MNQRVVLERLFRGGPATRAGLAEVTGISKVTAGLIIDELLEAGVLEEGALANDGRPGRPGRSVMLEHRTPRFLLIQIGVKRTDVSALPVGGESPGDRFDTSFVTRNTQRAWLSSLEETMRQLETRSLWAFMVSLPGLLDEQRAKILLSPNLHWTESATLGAAIPELLGIPGSFIQEHRALALGHIAATDDRDFLLVDSEDGVGAAIVMDGQVFHSSLPSAGEIGHTTVMGNRRQCGCGGRGCLETLISRPAILAAFATSTRQANPVWADVVESLASRSSPPGWLSPRLDAAAMVIGGALNTSGLGRVVLTGALAELPESVITPLTEKICNASLVGRLGQVTVEAAPRRRSLGMLQAVFSRLLTPTADWSRPCALVPESSHKLAIATR